MYIIVATRDQATPLRLETEKRKEVSSAIDLLQGNGYQVSVNHMVPAKLVPNKFKNLGAPVQPELAEGAEAPEGQDSEEAAS